MVTPQIHSLACKIHIRQVMLVPVPMGEKIGGMGVAINTTSPTTTTRYKDANVLRMPKKINSFESGLRQSPRLTEVRESK